MIFLIIVLIGFFYVLAWWIETAPVRRRANHDKLRQKNGPAPILHDEKSILGNGFKDERKRKL